MLINHDHFLHPIPIIDLILYSVIDSLDSIFSLTFAIFIKERWEACFFYINTFLETCLDHLIIFLYGSQLEIMSSAFGYKWSICLMIALFFTPQSFFVLLIEII